ncbi:MAG: GNAT family N-acetyltransferase [Clostridia bacterium]|nr:GNAT family N-acetyltransferase [Clostridia bacterium]
MYDIRLMRDADAPAVSALICHTLRTVNIRDYDEAYIERDCAALDPDAILRRAAYTHFYVVCDGERIIGCGAIGPYWGSETESSLFTIFVDPAYHGQGIGRMIIGTLEADAYFLRASRIEIPASITAQGFYRKMGYTYKNGVTEPDEEGLLRMEKHRTI